LPDAQFAEEIIKSNQNSSAWFIHRFNEVLAEIETKFNEYKLSEVLMLIYKLIWDDFCAWYLEMIKPAYQQPINESTYQQTIACFEELLKLLHPFMPFVSEEIWQQLNKRGANETICLANYPMSTIVNKVEMALVFETITAIRNLRNAKGLSPKENLFIVIKAVEEQVYIQNAFLIKKLANIAEMTFDKQAIASSNQVSLPVGTDEILVTLNLEIDVVAERIRMEQEIDYLKGFMKSVDAKLSNEKFVSNAKPELVEKERQKKQDAIQKIQVLEQSLKALAS
jgi:valyl-tRNA synthetase